MARTALDQNLVIASKQVVLAPTAPSSRLEQLDIARGIAIFLMVVSHGVKGLLTNQMIPEWGMVPIHLFTKFSSSLFIVVFGLSLSLFFVPRVGKSDWKTKRRRLLLRGLEIMLWYKILTFVQMFQIYPKQVLLDTLMFKRMPDFVEILGFYAFALFWIPFLLPLWKKASDVTKVLAVLAFFAVGQWLHSNFDFWGIESLKAILVEQKGYYTFGQFQRGALVLLGLFLGDIYRRHKQPDFGQMNLAWLSIVLGSLLLGSFYLINQPVIGESLWRIAHNGGKHPPESAFLSFSLGGALILLGMCMTGGRVFNKWMRPFALIGRHSLYAFVIHIVVIFYFYRYLFDLRHNVSYPLALALAMICTALIIGLLSLWQSLKPKRVTA